MKLTIITATSRHGLAGGSIWQWYLENVIRDTPYEVLDVTNVPHITGDRVLLMGQKVVSLYIHPELSLLKARGNLYQVAGLPAIPTFDLQEAYDFKAVDDNTKDDTFSKDKAKTLRTNWLFWIKADTGKLLRPIKQPTVPSVVVQPNLVQYTKYLLGVRGTTVYLDIETDRTSDTLDCIGLYVEGGKHVVVVPIYRHTGKLAYAQLHILRYLAALSYVLRNNRVVVHNAMFDLLYLSSHYRLPFGPDIFDTMLAHKRALPEIEKSLGHAISYWTWQIYHKDQHTINTNLENEQQLWQYNAKDVWSMREVYLAQLIAIKEDDGLRRSVEQANASVYPYLLASLKGVRVDVSVLGNMKVAADRRIKQILRVIHVLIGDPKFNPNSSQQLVRYFHTKLAYKVQSRTPTGAPSLDSKSLYSLALRYNNPLIQCIIHYHEIVKERSMMQFSNLIYPWQSL